MDELSQLISEIKLSLNDPLFASRVFTLVSRYRKALRAQENDLNKRICEEEYDDLSKRLDRSDIQESCSVRNVLRTRRIASLLINDKGELNLKILPQLANVLKNSLYSLGPDRHYDIRRQERILTVIEILQTNREVQLLLKKISRPYSHRYAEQIIRDTLQLPEGTIVTDAHTRRAVISAMMCFLRQNVGSCFATAPAIIVHDEQPEQFLKDIEELLGTGRLKRTYGGVEYAVPLSTSWGSGDLKKPFIIPEGPAVENTYIWQSPGLIAAFEAIGLFDKDPNLKDKVNETKKILLDLFKEMSNGRAFITSADELIRRVLLKQLNLTEQDLEDYENRPKGMIHGSLLMQMHKAAAGSGGKGEACSAFYLQLANAQNAFKALADNALLKAWEFTLASFSENKSGFTQWNLYSSLGLNPEEKGGIGFCLYEILKRKLDENNRKVEAMQAEYETVYTQLKFIEGRFRSVSSEKEAQWAKIEYQTKLNEFNLLEEMRNKYHYKSSRYANLFNVIVDIYTELFPKYFQEVYDADMHDVSQGPYDDSPAGFRLLFKHGRANTSQWTAIHNHHEFIDALATFFTATESELAGNPDMKGLSDDVSEIVTAIVNHIRTIEFIETAFYRMAISHNTRPIKNPLENLDKIEKKPWVYTSGGSMSTLISCYYRRDQKPTEVGRWVENPTELLVFLIDSIKQLPPKIMEGYVKNPYKSMLTHSPTHAFNLKPGFKCLRKMSESEVFTYTHVRDALIKPAQDFIDRLQLSEEMMEYLVDILQLQVPENYRHYFGRVFKPMHGTFTVEGFRDYLVDRLDKERGLQQAGRPVLSEEEIDSTLYSLLPLFPIYKLKEKIEAIFSGLKLEPGMIEKAAIVIDELLESRGNSTLVSSKNLHEICKAILALISLNTASSRNYDADILEVSRKLGFAMPPPLAFADTNWVKNDFGFLVNPGTGRLELWRIDPLGLTGSPMTAWNQWLNGTRRELTWGLYNRPIEYQAS